MSSDDQYKCGHERAAEDDWLRHVEPLALCVGEPHGCPRAREYLIIYFADPGQGFHRFPPLDIEVACARHRRLIAKRAAGRKAPGSPVQIRSFSELGQIYDEFHENGFCNGPRGISVATPGVSTSTDASVKGSSGPSG